MDLNLPIVERLAGCRNVLIAGAGGGFDLFCGLPVYFELLRRGQRVHLANLSFSDIGGATHGIRLSGSLVGVTNDFHGMTIYFPELYLARWLGHMGFPPGPIWSFAKTGAAPLLDNYRLLVERLEIDGLLLIDGGVDSLMAGDEAAVGTIIEDSLSLYAASELSAIPVRLLGCVGLGAEEGVAHAHVFENIARLARAGAFLGACSLTSAMDSYQLYEAAVLYAHHQPMQDPSVINASLISAVRGEYGNFHLTGKTRGSRLWISPLMALYWFFDLPAVAARNQLLPHLAHSYTFMEAVRDGLAAMRRLPRRPPGRVELL